MKASRKSQLIGLVACVLTAACWKSSAQPVAPDTKALATKLAKVAEAFLSDAEAGFHYTCVGDDRLGVFNKDTNKVEYPSGAITLSCRYETNEARAKRLYDKLSNEKTESKP